MNRARERLALGWRPGPATTAFIVAAVLLLAAFAIHAGGLQAGLWVFGGAAIVAALAWRDAWIEGPTLGLRSLRSAFAARVAPARSIDRLVYRHSRKSAALRLSGARGHYVLVASGRDPHAPAFRQAAMWLIVHGRRQAHIDPALLDALAVMPDHAPTGLPHDTSHA